MCTFWRMPSINAYIKLIVFITDNGFESRNSYLAENDKSIIISFISIKNIYFKWSANNKLIMVTTVKKF